MSIYTVITADIINSRNSSLSYDELENSLLKLNYPEEMLAPFMVLKGDEIQGVFKGFMKTPQVIRRLRYCLYPLKLRIGIGVGDIEEGLDKDTSWQMNGPAFHLARNSLEQIKEDNDFAISRLNSFPKKSTNHKNQANISTENNTKLKNSLNNNDNFALDVAINTILFLIDTIQEDWTKSQWEAISVYEEMGTYKKAAEKLGIAFQNVEKRCNAANWKQVEKSERNIRDIIRMWR